MSVESYSGMARFYRTDLAAFAKAVSDREISADFTDALGTAATSLDNFVENLKTRFRGTGKRLRHRQPLVFSYAVHRGGPGLALDPDCGGRAS